VQMSAARVRHDRHELLDALVLFDLAREDVALRVDHDRVDPVELTGIRAVPAEAAERLAARAIEDPYLVVGAVSHIQIFLLRVAGDRQLVSRPAGREVLAVETTAVLGALRRRAAVRVELRRGVARFALRFVLGFALLLADCFAVIFRDAVFFEALRDWAAVFAAFRRFLAMRAPPK